MRRVFFDTNILASLSEIDVELIEPFLVFVQKDNPDLRKILISDLVFLETYSFLNNRFTPEKASSFCNWLKQSSLFEIVNYDQSNLIKALSLAQKFSFPEKKKGISLVDAFLLLEAEAYDTVIYTTDEIMTLWTNKHKKSSAVLFR
ncbi:MAG: type II toxin-antitoxin system VapC family toxin [Patescibacteria group bacterium]